MEKMKKYILLCFVCFGVYGLSHAQWYVKGYTGYSFATGNDRVVVMEELRWLIQQENHHFEERYEFFHRGKFGQGLNLGLSLGYAFTQNIAFEITGNTQAFSTFSYSNPVPHLVNLDDEGVSVIRFQRFGFDDLEYTNRLFQFSLQIVLRSNPINQWIFYLKGGPNFMWATQTQTEVTALLLRPPLIFLETREFTGDMSIGLQCSLGVEYELSRNIGFFAELTSVNTRHTFNRGEILRHERDGIDFLHALRQTVFEDLDMKMSFNHIALNIGIKYTFR